ncbi:MAG: diguanylate cyclase [Pseudomonadota bacterium]
MTLDVPSNCSGAALGPSLLESQHRILSAFACGAPIGQTLADIAAALRAEHPGFALALMLLDAESGRWTLGASAGLPPGYQAGAGDAKWQAWAEGDDAPDFAETPFWIALCAAAGAHGMRAHTPLVLRSSTGGTLGLFVPYTEFAAAPAPGADALFMQSVQGYAPLATVAIERSRADTASLKAARLRDDEHARLALAIEGSGTGVWDRDVLSGQILYSSGWKALFGYTDEQITDRIEDAYLRVHPDDLSQVRATIDSHFELKSDVYVVEHRLLCADGGYKWASSRGKVVSRDADGKPLRMIGITTDVTAMRRMADQLQESAQTVTRLTNEVPALVFEMSLDSSGVAGFTYVSEGVREMFELTPAELAAGPQMLHKLIHADDLAAYRATLAESAATVRPWQLEYRVLLPRQGLRWREGSARPRQMADGSTQWHGFITDITERKNIEMELREFANIDALTRLPNRRCFMARMDTELARVRRVPGTRTAVLMFDIDFFKNVNDSYGHATGDIVLKHFATILTKSLREVDHVGRIGGEEFAVILSNADLAEGASFALRVQQRLAAAPLVDGGRTIAVTVSIGVAAMQPNDQNVDAALYRSDMALYRAKERGRNCVVSGDE